MQNFIPRQGRWSLGLFFAGTLLVVAAGVAWWQRDRLLTWYYLRQLAQAGEQDRELWVQRTASLDEQAVPGLLGSLRRKDDRACGNAQAALVQLAKNWGPGDPRAAALAGQLVELFPGLAPPGQQAVLEVGIALRGSDPAPVAAPSGLDSAAIHLLAKAAPVAHAGVRIRALELAGALVGRTTAPEVLAASRELVRTGLRDESAANRAQAAHLARGLGLDLLKDVVALLEDASAEVRRAALEAVRTSQEVIATDDLLRWLHDPDSEVRRLCEDALRARGLHERHIKLGRLITDVRAQVRLGVPEELRRASDLEPNVWLRRLSHDSEAAVRVAAVRAAAESDEVDLTDRLMQMAENDPKETVRQVAQHYLSYPKSKRASSPAP